MAEDAKRRRGIVNMGQCRSTLKLSNGIQHVCGFYKHSLTETYHTNGYFEWDNLGRYRSIPPSQRSASILHIAERRDSDAYAASRTYPGDPLRIFPDTLRDIPRTGHAPEDYSATQEHTQPYSTVTVRSETRDPGASGLTYAKVFAFMGAGLVMWAILFWLVILLVRTWETFP